MAKQKPGNRAHVEKFYCIECGAEPGESCTDAAGTIRGPHRWRRERAAQVEIGSEAAAAAERDRLAAALQLEISRPDARFNFPRNTIVGLQRQIATYTREAAALRK